jgi:antitoxin (DNA-binding transcriptional repressor) of toxin-antitoxin stability system
MSKTTKHMKSRKVRDEWKAVLDAVQNGQEIVVELYNRPVARIIPYKETPVNTYATRTDAIEAEIIIPIEASGGATRDEYDIEAIAEAVLGDHDTGYACTVDTDTFWSIVAANAR